MQTRERILEAARDCYRRLGVSGTSLAQIAQQAQCTRGAIYWHFPDCLKVLQAVLERGRLPLHERLDAVGRASAPVIAGLRACLDEALAEIHGNPRVRDAMEILALRCDFAGAYGSLLDTERRDAERIRDSLRRVLERAQQFHELRAGVDLAAMASLLLYILVGAIRVEFMQHRADTLKECTMAALDHVLASIRVAEEPP